jgi:hypothetical protein
MTTTRARASVKLTQIESPNTDAYLNTAFVGDGGIGLLARINDQPAALIRFGECDVEFATFASRAWCDEYFYRLDADDVEYEILWSSWGEA